nr:hypothetical protein [FCB group bacterium]
PPSSHTPADALKEIEISINKVADLVQEITGASHEQSAAINEINTSLSEIGQVTQATTASAEESASAAEELSNQSARLKEMLSKFSLRFRDNHDIRKPSGYTDSRRLGEVRTSSPQNIDDGNARNINFSREINPQDIISMDDDFGSF